MQQPPALSAALDRALAAADAGDATALNAWLTTAPRGASTAVTLERSWGEESWFALHLAAERGLKRAVSALLAAGAHPDSRTRFATPLHARRTALHLGAAGGHVGVLESLLDAGAQVEVRDARARSPLWEACRGRHADAVRALLAAGARLDAADAGGRVPLHAALLPGDHGPAETPDAGAALAVVAALLDAGADPDAVCPREPAGYTALMRCEMLGAAAAPIAAALRDAGADATLTPPVG